MNTKEYELRKLAKVFHAHDFFNDDKPCDETYEVLNEVFNALSNDNRDFIRAACKAYDVVNRGKKEDNP